MNEKKVFNSLNWEMQTCHFFCSKLCCLTALCQIGKIRERRRQICCCTPPPTGHSSHWHPCNNLPDKVARRAASWPALATLGGHYWMGMWTDCGTGGHAPCATLSLPRCSPSTGNRPPHHTATMQDAELCLCPALPGFLHNCRDPALLWCDTGDNTCLLSSQALKSSCSKVPILKCKLLFL